MIKIKGFSKRFGDLTLFDNVSLEINKNGLYYIMGENGIGKTTFFKCLLGLENFKGDIEYKGIKCKYCIFDDNPLYLNLTGFENAVILTEISLSKKEVEALVNHYMSRHTFFNKRVRDYSLGEKKMLSLIIIALLQPDLLILDEVTNGLDISNRKKLLAYLNKVKESTMILLSGHEFFYAEICQYLYIIKDRNIMPTTLKEVKKRYDGIISEEAESLCATSTL